VYFMGHGGGPRSFKGKVTTRIPPRYPPPSSAFPQHRSAGPLVLQAFSAIPLPVNIFYFNELLKLYRDVIRIVDNFF
jgi:hypothetical protein